MSEQDYCPKQATLADWEKLAARQLGGASPETLNTATPEGITLKAPVIRDPGASKSFPSSPALFASTVYPVVRQYCARCHTSTAAAAQSPFFASSDLDEAYAAARLIAGSWASPVSSTKPSQVPKPPPVPFCTSMIT